MSSKALTRKFTKARRLDGDALKGDLEGHIICHMLSSIDCKIEGASMKGLRPTGNTKPLALN